jgi:peptide alpha-N-acetyltransferase
MNDIVKLIEADLSEPYSIYTYRYFINNWPSLTILVLELILLQKNIKIICN